nr:uncharacterized protein LOC109146588 [Ipomoea batatas]GMD32820.1 uncharacterized protein LOC109146588 [Ipomoea batatas]
MVMDAAGPEFNVDEIEESPNPEAQKFYDMLKAADQELWPGSKKHSQLSLVARLMSLKSENHISEKCFNQFTELMKEVATKDNLVPENFYETKKLLRGMRNLKFPDGNAFNMSRCVDMKKLKLFAQAGIRYTDMVSKFKSNRTSTGKPACIHEDKWRIWEAYWDRPDVKAKSEQQRKNRMSERDELQKEHNLFECFEHMHKKKNGAFVDERSKKIVEEIQARHDAAMQEVEGSTEPPVINMSQLYVDVVGGVKKQCIYGLGTKASSFINDNSCSSSATSQFHQDTMKEMLDTMRVVSLMDELRRNGIIPTTSTPQPPTTEGHSINSNDEDLGND